MSTLAPARHDHRDSEFGPLIAVLSLEERIALLTGATTWTLTELPSIGLRTITMSDGPIGVRGIDGDTTTSAQLPSPSGMAATWDIRILDELGALMAREAERKGVDVVLAPVVNLQRTPVGGRHFECFSEDPLLTGRLAGAFVAALQRGGVGASVKHFIGNESETDRTTYIAAMDERTLREVYLAPFEHVVRTAGAWTVMAAYNAFSDGELAAPSTEHGPLLNSILKHEWGFDGVVVSDWLANKTTIESALGGLDLEMPGPTGLWGAALLEAVRGGSVPEAVVNDKVERLLRLAERVGALSGLPGTVHAREVHSSPQQADAADVRNLLQRAAARGTVVLRNDGGILPLVRETVSSIALIGANAVHPFVQGGGSAHVDPPHLSAPLAAIRAAFPDAEVSLTRGGVTETNAAPIEDALLRTPNGDSGILLQLLDDVGGVLEARVLASARELWVRDPPEGATTARFVTLVELGGGSDEIELAPVGAHVVRVNGKTLSESDRIVGAEVVLDSSYSNPTASSIVVEGASALIEADVQVVDAAAFGRFARFHLRHRPPRLSNAEEIELAVAAAADAETAVVIVGTNPETESEGWDRANLSLPGDQDELVRRVAAANPRTIVVVNAGAPVLLPWLDDVAAVLWWWLPGQEAGAALADVLAGEIEPSGRLPWTLPAREEDVPVPNGLPAAGVVEYAEGLDVGHRGWDRLGRNPARPFGYGLGYTTWNYLSIVPSERNQDGDVVVEVDVTNTGSRAGREVVQVYLSSDGSDVVRPIRWLAGFAVVDARPGETVTATITVARRAFEVWDTSASGWTLPSGQYTLSAGRSSRDLLIDVAVGIDSQVDYEASRL